MNTKSRRTLRRLLAVAVTATVLGHSSHAAWAQDGGQPQAEPNPSQLNTGDLNDARRAVQGDAAPAAQAAGDPQRISPERTGTENLRNRLDDTRRSDAQQRAYGQDGQRYDGSDWQGQQRNEDGGISAPSPDDQYGQQGREAAARMSQRPVYNRDAQGRFYFDDSIGQRFVFTDQGRWVHHGSDSEGQSKPRLGVTLTESSRGLQVSNVVRGSEAEIAGVQQGDIILRANGENVGSPQDFVRRIENLDQDQVELTVIRDGQEANLTANLAATDAYQVAKPAIEGDGRSDGYEHAQSSDGLSQRLDRLEREIDQLKSQLDDRSLEAGTSQARESAARQGSDAGTSQAQDASLFDGLEAPEPDSLEPEAEAPQSDRLQGDGDL